MRALAVRDLRDARHGSEDRSTAFAQWRAGDRSANKRDTHVNNSHALIV
jgi:hypothetical protein